VVVIGVVEDEVVVIGVVEDEVVVIGVVEDEVVVIGVVEDEVMAEVDGNVLTEDVVDETLEPEEDDRTAYAATLATTTITTMIAAIKIGAIAPLDLRISYESYDVCI
ncbi:MAG: hypothetical protein ABSF83_12505, partial [Nitrososphaerales archaeon]